MTNPRLAITITADGRQAEQSAGRVAKAFDGIESSAGKASSATLRAGDSVGKFLAASIAAGGVTAVALGFVKAADAVTSMSNALKLATGSAVEASRAYGALFDIAQRSRVSFTDLGATFASVSRAGEALGLSQSRLLGVTEAIGNSIAIAGGSAASAQAGLTQLAQGLASGVLRGDEFNSVVEQTPRLARALADGLGVPIGRLREMAEAGELTAARVIAALESQSAALRGEVADSVLTVGQAWTQLQNATIKAVGDLDQATGTSAAVASALSSLASVVGNLGTTLRENSALIGAVMGGVGALATAAAVAKVGAAITVVRTAFIALTATMAANPVGLALLGIGAVVGAAVAAGEKHRASLKGLSEEVERTSERIENAERKLKAAGGPRGQLTAGLEQHLAELKAHRAKVQAEVEKIKQAEAEATGTASAAGAGRGVVNPQTVGQQLAAEQALADKRREWLGKYATDSERLRDELAKARDAFGGMIPPDIEARIRARFIKPVQDSSAALEPARDAARAWADAWGDFAKIQADASSKGDELTAGQRRLVEFLQSPAYRDMPETARQLALNQAYAAITAEQQAAETRTVAQAAADMGKAFAEGYARQRDAAERSAQSVADRLAAIEAENEAAALAEAFNLTLAEAVERVAMARLADAKAAAIQRGNMAEAAAIQAEIDAREQLIRAMKTKEAREVGQKTRQREADEWAKTWDQVGQSFADELMRGGKTGAEYVRGLFRTMVLRPLVMGTVQSAMGWAGLGSGAGGGGASNAAQLQQWASMAQAGAKAWGWATGSTAAGSAGAAGTAAGSAGAGSAGAGAAAGSMAWAGWAAAIALGIKKASSDYSEGFRRDQAKDVSRDFGYGVGGYESDLANGLSKLGFSDRWADLLSGSTAVAKIFGRAAPRTVDAGIMGTIGGTGESFQAFEAWRAKGGLLRSDRNGINTRALDAGMAEGLAAGAQGVRDQVSESLKALGLAADGVGAFTTSVKISLMGLDAKGQQAAITAALSGYGDQLVSALFDRVGEFQREGETTGATLARLRGALASVNESLDALGMSALSASVDGAAAAQQLTDLFGGSDGLAGAVSSFMENYYTEAERSAATTRRLAREFDRLGIAMPATKDEFRALVEAQDLTTESGRAAYLSLLSLSDSFAGVADAAQQAAGTLSDEIRRLTGANAASSRAGSRALFESTAARAAAGDAAAVAALPDIARAVEDQAATMAATSDDLARVRAFLASTLSDVAAANGAARGVFSVDAAAGLAPSAAGLAPTIGPSVAAPSSPAAQGPDLAAEIVALRQVVEGLRADQAAQASAIARHTSATASALQRAMPDGDAIATRPAA